MSLKLVAKTRNIPLPRGWLDPARKFYPIGNTDHTDWALENASRAGFDSVVGLDPMLVVCKFIKLGWERVYR